MFYRYVLNLVVVLVLSFSPFNLAGLFPVEKAYAASPGDALWARSTVMASGVLYSFGITTDPAGNIYAVGAINGAGEYNFGNSVTVSGNNTNRNAVIVKYNSSGEAQWAKSTVVAPNRSHFYSVATGAQGNVYAIGYITGNNEYNFGNGVTVAGNYAGNNTVIVKYNSSGEAQWAKSTVVAPNSSYLQDATVDTVGSIYVVGTIYGNGEYNFGNGVTVAGNYAGNNTVIVKYNSSGEAQWAKSTVVAPSFSGFEGVAVDTAGNTYAIGYIRGTGEYNFGNGVTVAGSHTVDNAVVVKYNSSGEAQWARSTVVAPSGSEFFSATTDYTGNIYTVGNIWGTGEYNFGNGVTVAGNYTSYNAVVVKYNSSGEAQWARSTAVAPGDSMFQGMITDATGNVYTVGYIGGTGEYNFGNGVTVTGSSGASNTVIVKYNSSGEAQWAKSTVVAPNRSHFYSVATDAVGSIYALGHIGGTGEYNFGNGVTATGVYGGGGDNNFLLVKYAGLNTDIVYQDLPSNTVPINIEDGEVVTTPLFTIRVKPYSAVGISKVEFYVDDNLLCTSHTSDKDGVYSCKWDTTKYQSTIKIVAYNTLGERETIVRTASVVLPSTTAGKETTAELTVLPKTGR